MGSLHGRRRRWRFWLNDCVCRWRTGPRGRGSGVKIALSGWMADGLGLRRSVGLAKGALEER